MAKLDGCVQFWEHDLMYPANEPSLCHPCNLDRFIEEMVALRDEGKIAGIGISNATLAEVDTAIELAGIVCVQNAFSLLDRHDADVLERCESVGIAYVPFFPLGSAFPHMPKVIADPTVQSIATRIGTTPSQVGLAWLLALADNILLIPGTSSVEHLEENMAVGAITLTDADLAELH